MIILSRQLAASLMVLLSGGWAIGGEIYVPCPVTTIYPGEIIRDDLLRDMSVDDRAARDSIRARGDLVGRVARRTLFAGTPISVWSVDAPNTITNGSQVRIIFDQPGISISAVGLALQSGRTGDSIRVRNIDSGLVVTGVVAPTGAVMVGN